MNDSLLFVALFAGALVLPIRYVIYRVRTRGARRSALEDGREPPRFESHGRADSGSLGSLVVLVILVFKVGQDEPVPVDREATGVCTVAEGRSFPDGVERRMVSVSTYSEHSAFVDALSDTLGSAARVDSLGSVVVGDSLASVPDSTVSGARWPSVRSLTESRPVEIKARFTSTVVARDSVNALRRNVMLTANGSGGADALSPELSTRVTEVAQSILSSAPDLFRCTAVERYP